MEDKHFGFLKLILVFCQAFACHHYVYFLRQVFVKIATSKSIFINGHWYPSDILTLNVTQLYVILEKPNITSWHLCPWEINAFKDSPKIIFL